MKAVEPAGNNLVPGTRDNGKQLPGRDVEKASADTFSRLRC